MKQQRTRPEKPVIIHRWGTDEGALLRAMALAMRFLREQQAQDAQANVQQSNEEVSHG